jgi:hypothetical protein
MPPQPAQRNRACERGAELIRRATLFEEGTVDQLSPSSEESRFESGTAAPR